MKLKKGFLQKVQIGWDSNDSRLLSKFLRTNKEVIRLKELAFQIKLKSINEQILSIRFDMQRTGFQVVSKELIHFSNLFEDIARDMLGVMSKMFPMISGSLKKQKLFKIKEHAIALSRKIESKEMLARTLKNHLNDEQIQNQEKLLKDFFRIIAKTETLSLQGNVIFLQSKITGAYSNNALSTIELAALTEDLGNDINQIRNCVHQIKNIWETA